MYTHMHTYVYVIYTYISICNIYVHILSKSSVTFSLEHSGTKYTLAESDRLWNFPIV